MDNLADEFKSRGYEVWTISCSKSSEKYLGCIDGIHRYNVKHDLYKSVLEYKASHSGVLTSLIFKTVSLIRHFLFFPIYPNVSPFSSKRVYRLANRIVDQNGINIVVCPYHHYENIYTAIKLKKIYGEKLRVVTYHLDLRTVTGNKNSFVRNYVKKRAFSSLVKENKVVDKMLVPFTGRSEMESIMGLNHNKIFYLGFPVFVPTNGCEIKCETPFEKNTINIAYIGTLAADNRPPQYILRLVEKIHKISGLNVMIHFWGGFEGSGLKEILENSPVAKYHGILDKKYLTYMVSQCDFVLNIGNMTTPHMLPSKIFSFFASGKPIISIINNAEDASIPYLEMYGNIIMIKSYNNHFEKDVELLLEKISKPHNIDQKAIISKFKEFTPSYICDEIMK
jgi:hypothetical protein